MAFGDQLGVHGRGAYCSRLRTDAGVTFLQNIRSIETEGDVTTPIQVDGEIVCHLPVRIAADAQRFEILA